MELKEFIKETIVQITDGLREGNQYVTKNKFGEGVSDNTYKEINFDVAVTSNNQETTGMGGKISVASIISFGGNDEIATKSSNVSRIQFKINLHVKTAK